MKISREVAITKLVAQVDDWDLDDLIEYVKGRRRAYLGTLGNKSLAAMLNDTEDVDQPFVVRGRR
jgi:hypothetical protein